jgi:hypothetical protein
MKAVIIIYLALFFFVIVATCSGNEDQSNSNWTSTLHSSITDITKIRVRSGGTCHRQITQESTLLEINDKNIIRDFINHIQVNDAESGFHCMCCGHPTFEFYRGDKLLVSLGFHHGRSLRWGANSKWTGDALLTRESADYLIHWLADNSVNDPLDEVMASKKEAEEMKAKLERATLGMPEALKKSISKNDFAQKLKQTYDSEEKQLAILLSILGTSNDSWTSYDWIDKIPDEILRSYNATVLKKVVRTALLGNDRRKRRGAARFWESWKSPLEDWNPPDKAHLHSIILTVQQESAYYPLRQQALDNLRAWRDELDEGEVNSRLFAGLQDPNVSVRRKAMLTAGRMNYQSAAPLIVKVLRGDSIEYNDLPNILPEEKVYVSEGGDDIAGRRPETEVAALSLGYLGYGSSSEDIRSLPDSPMKNVALALLGETDRIKPEYFMLEERNKELQLAAVEAVVRSKGKVGLEWAINYKMSTHWWESEYVLQKLQEMLIANNAPETEMIKNAASLKDLNKWYSIYGESYIKQISTQLENTPNPK